VADDQLLAHGGQSKQDFAVEVTGPVVREIRENMLLGPSDRRAPWWKRGRYWLSRFPRELGDSEDGQALFGTRDNGRHAADIEMLYRIAIRSAQREIVLANAYFFPGYRLIRDLIRAHRRGVRVRLILQGMPDFPLVLAAASIIYDDLAAAGVEIYQYTRRPLHAKIAIIDGRWATVGSSNLDPTSLGLNFEANLFILDEPFNRGVKQRLEQIIEASCEQYVIGSPQTSRIRRLLAAAAYRLTRRMALWGRMIQRRRQRAAALV
jgi:cardiolipin synthase A/B